MRVVNRRDEYETPFMEIIEIGNQDIMLMSCKDCPWIAVPCQNMDGCDYAPILD